MVFLKKVGGSIKKTANVIGKEIKTRQEISQAKRRILNRFKMKDLNRICKNYGIGKPLPSKKELVTGKDGKLYLTSRKIPARREHYVKKIMTELNLEQIEIFADKHIIDMPDILKEEKKSLRRAKEIKEHPNEKKITKPETTECNEFDSILKIIENFRPQPFRNEKDFEKQLYQYLDAKLPNHVVDRQIITLGGFIDLFIYNKYGIELKIAWNRSSLRHLTGQIFDYLKGFDNENLAVVILDVKMMSPYEINEYIEFYKRLGIKVVVLPGYLIGKKRKLTEGLD